MRYKIAFYNSEEGCSTSATTQDHRRATFRLDDWHKI